MSVMTMSFCTALHMSYTVRAAADTAVRASISTPVFPSQVTVAVISTEHRSSSRESSRSTPSKATGWHMGISSGVRFAPMMPAICATVSTSPFFSPPERMSCEKILAAFLELLLSGDHAALERIETALEDQEESLIRDKISGDFDMELLKSKKRLSRRASYYAQLMDITDAVHENDNGIFNEKQLIHIDNISMRLGSLREETARLRSTVEHLQDAYSSYLDMKLNKTMKLFTVLTSIFFPLTIIVGWYGMNFQNMPELAWRYGYIYVIALSVITVAVFFIIGKRRKWF